MKAAPQTPAKLKRATSGPVTRLELVIVACQLARESAVRPQLLFNHAYTLLTNADEFLRLPEAVKLTHEAAAESVFGDHDRTRSFAEASEELGFKSRRQGLEKALSGFIDRGLDKDARFERILKTRTLNGFDVILIRLLREQGKSTRYAELDDTTIHKALADKHLTFDELYRSVNTNRYTTKFALQVALGRLQELGEIVFAADTAKYSLAKAKKTSVK
jgi:hypothetical protein